MLHAKSRLTLNQPFHIWIRDAAAANVVQILPLDVEVVVALNGLPASFHGDPADRLIVSTSRAQKIPLATHDAAIKKSSIIRFWKPNS
jgi:PIN domain nuclease of toxin-antitoxin system